MGKKYSPSGYQIINISCNNVESEVAKDITPSTEDEKQLLKILIDLSNRKPIKPVLLRISINDDDYVFNGFANSVNSYLSLYADPDNSFIELSTQDGEKISLYFKEM